MKQYNTNRYKPGYVGYMYGNIDGTTYDEVYQNTNDSNVKQELDKWYKTNILDKNLDGNIADSGFCNDRSIVALQANNGDGVSLDTSTYYSGYKRIITDSTPSYICPNKERDLFTLRTNEILGNKALTYPVGLITADELAYAGMSGERLLNRMSFVYSTASYWTMTPSRFTSNASSASSITLYSEGRLYQYSNVITTMSIRPVINLSKDTLISGGIGTSNNPFVIKAS